MQDINLDGLGDREDVARRATAGFDQTSPDVIRARRTAFVARFIVLRETKRSRAHRTIEFMDWTDATSAEELAGRFRQAFVDNGDSLSGVDRDIRRALAHSSRSISYFIREYRARATVSFIQAMVDYERSNALLFGDDDPDRPKTSGWRLPKELERLKSEKK